MLQTGSWIERQRVANDDSLYWWMTHLAGKNNAGTKFFSNMIKLIYYTSLCLCVIWVSAWVYSFLFLVEYI